MKAVAIDRRSFLAGSAASLVIGFSLPAAGQAADTAAARALNAWVRIGTDDTVTLILSQCEIGQGISTTLPAILADELGADWPRVVVETAPVADAYRNPNAHWMYTGNAESIQVFAAMMRKAGAAAREMLTEAAARRWKVKSATCRAGNGVVVHLPSKRRFKFGELAEAAAALPVPANPKLKADADLKLIGCEIERRDIPAKVDGSAVFGIDFHVPGMVYAALRLVPTFGGSVASLNAASVAGMPGVIAAVPVPGGVAVVAEHFWQAKTAAAALDITFDSGPNAALSSTAIDAQYRRALDASSWGRTSDRGDVTSALAGAAKSITREYWSPFLAHATMEPMNCTASVTADRCDVWAPTQGPEMTKVVAAAVSGLPADKVNVHWTYSGGGFGRRLLGDFVAHAVAASKAVARPVKVIWTREDDLGHDMYRPGVLALITAGLDQTGKPTAIASKLVSPTQLQPVAPGPLPPNVDPRVTEGLEQSRYDIANFRLDFHRLEVAVPTSVLRTTGFGPNVFAFESLIDELAHEAGQDPYLYRRALLARDARARRVLDLAAEKSDWGRALPAGRARGIAFCDAFNTMMAQVVELSVDKKAIRVHRLTTVADPGIVYDPGIARSNLEGGAIFGLTNALKSEITFESGRAAQSNFDGYDVVHLWEAPPRVDTFLLTSPGTPAGGLGEIGPVCIPPALANALFAATGERVRALPVSRSGYTVAT
jgi:isoquinoline 1-oxidoreductase subunit beta